MYCDWKPACSLALLLALIPACGGGGDVAQRAAVLRDPGPGVSLPLARARAASISQVRYEIRLAIPAQRTEPVTGQITTRFVLERTQVGPGAPLVLDFARPASAVLGVRINGHAGVLYELRDEHLIVSATGLRDGDNELQVDFVAGDGSLNRNDDFLYTLFVPDRARTALPVFDQPDLKARYRLTLEVPAGWEVLANGAEARRTVQGQRMVVEFEPTEPIATYGFAFAAGRLQVAQQERNGRTMRLFHRETDTDKVARNLDAIFDLHAAALAWLERYTGIRYPFGKLDFFAVPAFQYGGMEHPGAIFYRARSLFLDPAATQNQLLGRASVIAHETAHMWFGNLVTMRWFNDVWMKEVFANFMAAKIVNPSFPEVNHELRFLLAHYPAAYAVDRTDGANPIRQPLENLAEAGTLYGAIIYQKAPVVMRQLELLLGPETFRDGLREYLDAHRYGNATWPDLIDVLDARSPEDLHAWSRVWVEQPGRPRIAAVLQDRDGAIDSLRLRQQDPRGEGRVWNERLEVLLGDAEGGGRRLPVQLDAPELEVRGAAGAQVPAFVLANGAGLGYGRFVLDDGSKHWLLQNLSRVQESRSRAAAWLTLWDGMLEAEVGRADLLHLGMDTLRSEPDELVVQQLLGDLTTLYWRYLSASERSETAPDLEQLLWRRLRSADKTSLRAAYFRTYRSVALTDEAVARLRRIWSGQERIEGLPLSIDDTTALAQELAVRGVPDAEVILDAQLQRITNPDRRARFRFVRPALSADVATRLAFFESLRDPRRREHEPWVLDALAWLHHPLRAASAEPTIRPGLEMLEEIQRTGDIFFPLRWLTATLSGHNTPGAANIVRTYLQQHPELPPRLRGKLLQAADPLFRAARLVH